MADTLSAGTTLQNGKYRIIRFISRSGLDFTYEAEHTLMNVRVAIKELYVEDLCRREDDDSITVLSEKKTALVRRIREKFIAEANKPGVFRRL